MAFSKSFYIESVGGFSFVRQEVITGGGGVIDSIKKLIKKKNILRSNVTQWSSQQLFIWSGQTLGNILSFLGLMFDFFMFLFILIVIILYLPVELHCILHILYCL